MDLRRKNKDTVRAVVHNPQVDGENKKKKNRRGGKKEQEKFRKEAANPELATQLREYGENYGLEEDPYLEGLSQAIEDGKNLAIWASNDVMALMPHPDVESVEGPIYSAMVLIRNVLVFVPVALTWLAVGKATTSFSVYTTKSSAASVVNFLQFWQNGYGVLAKMWTLSHIAEDDFYIIATVIFLTFITPFMNRSAVKKAAFFEQDALRERLSLVIEVESFLFDKRRLTPLNIDSALAQSFDRVVEATRSLSVASNRIELGIQSLPMQIEVIPPTDQFEGTFQKRYVNFDAQEAILKGLSKKEKKKFKKNPLEARINRESVELLALKFEKNDSASIDRVTNSVESVSKRVHVIVQSLPRKTHAHKELKKVELELEETHAELIGLQKNLMREHQRVQKRDAKKASKRKSEQIKEFTRTNYSDNEVSNLMDDE
jgi:hypothetical protein